MEELQRADGGFSADFDPSGRGCHGRDDVIGSLTQGESGFLLIAQTVIASFHFMSSPNVSLHERGSRQMQVDMILKPGKPVSQRGGMIRTTGAAKGKTPA
jgi:hypothetical protein